MMPKTCVTNRLKTGGGPGLCTTRASPYMRKEGREQGLLRGTWNRRVLPGWGVILFPSGRSISENEKIKQEACK